MTNYQKWCSYTKELAAPQIFLDFGFYFTIAAALQRRVWIGSLDSKPLFPNIYPILCGPPGVGKGITLDSVDTLLRANKAYEQEGIRDAGDLFVDNKNSSSVVEASSFFFNTNYAQKASHKSNKETMAEKPLLFPHASNTITWQGLIKSFIDSMAAVAIAKEDGTGFKPYIHCSLVFNLSELSSLFHKNAEEVTRMLVDIYDCKDYTYETLSRAKERIKSPCLSLIAGTTPEFMKHCFDGKLASEGLSSRVWFIYADKNRHQRLFYPPLTIEQKMAQGELILHLKSLAKVKGPVTFSQEAHKYLDNWWQTFPKLPKANESYKLIHYYARKQVHVMKLAMAVHFAEVENINDKVITKSSIKTAMSLLEEAEVNMHQALNYKTQNALAECSNRILKLIRYRGLMTFKEIHEQVWEELKTTELEEALETLVRLGKIKIVSDETTKTVKGYKLV